MKRSTRFLSLLLALCFSWSYFVQTAHAALLTTEQVSHLTATPTAADGHARLSAMLGRADVQAQLERFGVSADDARERIAALTDDEAARLADQVETAPAGGDVLGAILLVFFVLLATDILGLTKIFPFTRSIR